MRPLLIAFAFFAFSASVAVAQPAQGVLGTLPLSPPRAETASRQPDDLTRLFNEAALPPASGVTAEPSAPLAPQARPSTVGDAGSAIAGIRVGDREGETRFVVELSGNKSVRYQVFTLADPYRVIVDFPDLASRLPESGGEKGRGVIADYRYGEFQNNTFRVVIDTTGPVSVSRNFVLDPQGGFGPRVVLDLAPTDRASFLRTAGLPGPDKAASIEKKPERAVTAPQNPAARAAHRRVVVIDPGHGGVDPGTHGRSSGVVEKDVVLAFSKELAQKLRATGRYEVHLTRDKDVFIPLRGRVQIARQRNADLFISIHADSIAKPDVRGMSIYTLSETASDKEAAELARKENLSDVIAGIDFQGESKEVTGILIDLAQRETKNYSVRFARSVVDYARHSTALLDPAHRFAGFVVLKAPDVPSVLVELGFLTNRADEKQLTSPKWRSSVATSFVRAIDRYFGDRLAEGPN